MADFHLLIIFMSFMWIFELCYTCSFVAFSWTPFYIANSKKNDNSCIIFQHIKNHENSPFPNCWTFRSFQYFYELRLLRSPVACAPIPASTFSQKGERMQATAPRWPVGGHPLAWAAWLTSVNPLLPLHGAFLIRHLAMSFYGALQLFSVHRLTASQTLSSWKPGLLRRTFS